MSDIVKKVILRHSGSGVVDVAPSFADGTYFALDPDFDTGASSIFLGKSVTYGVIFTGSEVIGTYTDTFIVSNTAGNDLVYHLTATVTDFLPNFYGDPAFDSTIDFGKVISTEELVSSSTTEIIITNDTKNSIEIMTPTFTTGTYFALDPDLSIGEVTLAAGEDVSYGVYFIGSLTPDEIYNDTLTLKNGYRDDIIYHLTARTFTNLPPVVGGYTFYIDENSSNGTVIGTIIASDPDIEDTVTYEITSGNGSGAFAINSITGVITVLDGSQLNYEVTTNYNLTVTVSDETSSSESIVVINVNDINEAPIASDGTFSVASDAANGTVVCTIAASDPDSGDILAFSITGGNTGSSFAVNPGTGELTVADNSSFIAGAQYILTIDVSDGSLSDIATITINIIEACLCDVDFATTYPGGLQIVGFDPISYFDISDCLNKYGGYALGTANWDGTFHHVSAVDCIVNVTYSPAANPKIGIVVGGSEFILYLIDNESYLGTPGYTRVYYDVDLAKYILIITGAGLNTYNTVWKGVSDTCGPLGTYTRTEGCSGRATVTIEERPFVCECNADFSIDYALGFKIDGWVDNFFDFGLPEVGSCFETWTYTDAVASGFSSRWNGHISTIDPYLCEASGAPTRPGSYTHTLNASSGDPSPASNAMLMSFPGVYSPWTRIYFESGDYHMQIVASNGGGFVVVWEGVKQVVREISNPPCSPIGPYTQTGGCISNRPTINILPVT